MSKHRINRDQRVAAVFDDATAAEREQSRLRRINGGKSVGQAAEGIVTLGGSGSGEMIDEIAQRFLQEID